jgi:hypothetical protein
MERGMETCGGVDPTGLLSGTLAYLRNFSPYMEPENSIPYSQEPISGPHPESDRSSRHIHTNFNII